MFTPPIRFVKAWPHGRFGFFCTRCKDYYLEALSKPLKGIDRPEGADEDWKPSIMEHIRHARIAMEFEDRNLRPPTPVVVVNDLEIKRRGWTPAQVMQVRVMRGLFIKYALTSGNSKTIGR